LPKSLMLMVLAYALLGTSFAQSNNEQLKILVHEFVLDTNESRTNTSIDVSIPLADSFKRFSDMETVEKTNFQQVKLSDLENRTLSADMSGLDVVVFGSYIIVNEYVKINSIIYNVKTGLYHRINYSRGTIDGIEVLIDEVADDIYEKLVEISPLLQGAVKKIAFVSDFETISGNYDSIKTIRSEAEGLTREIIKEAEYRGPSNSEVISSRVMRDYKDMSSAELITKLEPDMYVRLTFIFDEIKLVSLRTDFSIVEKGRAQIQKRDFTLPELKVGYYSNIEFIEFAINELSNFLERIINQNGQWEYIFFPTKTSTTPENANILMYKAENFSVRNDFYLSNYHYYEALNQFPESVNPADIRLQIGFNKIYLNRMDEATEEFDFVLKNSDNNGYAYLGKSMIEYYKTNYNSALDLLDQAIENGIDNQYLIEALRGFYYFEMKEFNNALDAFSKALTIKPGKIKVRLVNSLSKANLKIHIGMCYLGLSQFNQAVDYYEKLKTEFPNNEELPYYLSNAYSKRGIEAYFSENYQQAIQDFNNSRKYYQNSNINDYLRTAYIYEGKFAEAESYIENEIKDNKYDPRYIWMTHGMDIRMLLIDKHKQNPQNEFDKMIGEEAIKSFNKSAEYDINDPFTFFYIGEVNILLGRNEEGLNDMEKAFEADPFNFEIQLGLMQAYLINDQYEACSKLYKRSSKINRKLTVTPRATALMNFFLISAATAQDKNEKKAEKELLNLLKEEIRIDGWIYQPYLNWLENCSCSPEAKTELTELVNNMMELDQDQANF